MFRVCSECVQGWLSRLVVKIVVIALFSASSVSFFGIFLDTLYFFLLSSIVQARAIVGFHKIAGIRVI